MARLLIAWAHAIARSQQHVQQVAVAIDACVIAAVRLRAAQVAQGDRQQPQGGEVVPHLASSVAVVSSQPMLVLGFCCLCC